jgi:hypothetical protein
LFSPPDRTGLEVAGGPVVFPRGAEIFSFKAECGVLRKSVAVSAIGGIDANLHNSGNARPYWLDAGSH